MFWFLTLFFRSKYFWKPQRKDGKFLNKFLAKKCFRQNPHQKRLWHCDKKQPQASRFKARASSSSGVPASLGVTKESYCPPTSFSQCSGNLELIAVYITCSIYKARHAGDQTVSHRRCPDTPVGLDVCGQARGWGGCPGGAVLTSSASPTPPSLPVTTSTTTTSATSQKEKSLDGITMLGSDWRKLRKIRNAPF